ENFRRLVTNAILWTAKLDVPKDGAKVELDPKELKKNMDRKVKQGKGDVRLDPRLETMLRQPARDDRARKSGFFKALTELAKNHGRDLDELPCGRFIEEGRAVRFQAGDATFVVAILRGDTHTIPGNDTQSLLLFDSNGSQLDKLFCSINSRLTKMFVESGMFCTDVPNDAEKDGAQLIVRYLPEKGGKVGGNWSHSITHQGMTTSYPWRRLNPDGPPIPDFEHQGLCRVAIRDGKFSIMFPKSE